MTTACVFICIDFHLCVLVRFSAVILNSSILDIEVCPFHFNAVTFSDLQSHVWKVVHSCLSNTF